MGNDRTSTAHLIWGTIERRWDDMKRSSTTTIREGNGRRHTFYIPLMAWINSCAHCHVVFWSSPCRRFAVVFFFEGSDMPSWMEESCCTYITKETGLTQAAKPIKKWLSVSRDFGPVYGKAPRSVSGVAALLHWRDVTRDRIWRKRPAMFGDDLGRSIAKSDGSGCQIDVERS
jgi:hypothetical protein